MSLPEHLVPKTYWERRVELLEESVTRIAQLLNHFALPFQAQQAMREHFEEWNRLQRELLAEFPAPTDDNAEGKA